VNGSDNNLTVFDDRATARQRSTRSDRRFITLFVVMLNGLLPLLIEDDDAGGGRRGRHKNLFFDDLMIP
jgi:hypothetical protein